MSFDISETDYGTFKGLQRQTGSSKPPARHIIETATNARLTTLGEKLLKSLSQIQPVTMHTNPTIEQQKTFARDYLALCIFIWKIKYSEQLKQYLTTPINNMTKSRFSRNSGSNSRLTIDSLYEIVTSGYFTKLPVRAVIPVNIGANHPTMDNLINYLLSLDETTMRKKFSTSKMFIRFKEYLKTKKFTLENLITASMHSIEGQTGTRISTLLVMVEPYYTSSKNKKQFSYFMGICIEDANNIMHTMYKDDDAVAAAKNAEAGAATAESAEAGAAAAESAEDSILGGSMSHNLTKKKKYNKTTKKYGGGKVKTGTFKKSSSRQYKSAKKNEYPLAKESVYFSLCNSLSRQYLKNKNKITALQYYTVNGVMPVYVHDLMATINKYDTYFLAVGKFMKTRQKDFDKLVQDLNDQLTLPATGKTKPKAPTKEVLDKEVHSHVEIARELSVLNDYLHIKYDELVHKLILLEAEASQQNLSLASKVIKTFMPVNPNPVYPDGVVLPLENELISAIDTIMSGKSDFAPVNYLLTQLAFIQSELDNRTLVEFISTNPNAIEQIKLEKRNAEDTQLIEEICLDYFNVALFPELLKRLIKLFGRKDISRVIRRNTQGCIDYIAPSAIAARTANNVMPRIRYNDGRLLVYLVENDDDGDSTSTDDTTFPALRGGANMNNGNKPVPFYFGSNRDLVYTAITGENIDGSNYLIPLNRTDINDLPANKSDLAHNIGARVMSIIHRSEKDRLRVVIKTFFTPLSEIEHEALIAFFIINSGVSQVHFDQGAINNITGKTFLAVKVFSIETSGPASMFTYMFSFVLQYVTLNNGSMFMDIAQTLFGTYAIGDLNADRFYLRLKKLYHIFLIVLWIKANGYSDIAIATATRIIVERSIVQYLPDHLSDNLQIYFGSNEVEVEEEEEEEEEEE